MQTAWVMNTYSRYPVTFVSGKGCWLVDTEGKEYLDCLAGIAVVSAGHCNPEITAALTEQAGRLGHVSNYFWTEEVLKLAERLQSISGGGWRSFFSNSGAEANECALKLVRKWAGPGRFEILCAAGSFHGRTLGTLAATGQPAKWEGFEPLPAGFKHLPFNDLDAFARAISAETAGILVEPVQGEGGVIPARPEFLQGLRELCLRHKLALVFDEVQTGMGRTGSWWAYQGYGVTPDLFTSAKALANGFPIGACLARDEFAAVLTPGTHASTFGGNPLACRTALATINFLEREGLVSAAKEKGERLLGLLRDLPGVKEARGRGLLCAAVLKSSAAKQAAAAALERGLIVNAVTADTLRLAPPLTISNGELDLAAARLRAALEGVF